MIRILGVISGAALSIAALTWFVGVPQFTSERVVSDAPGGMPPVLTGETLPLKPQIDTTVDTPGESDTGEPPEVAEPDIAPPSIPEVDDSEPMLAAAETPVVPVEMAIDIIDEPNWFAFWSPFRSEIAANGFVGELQRVTGLDYRVVKVKPGVYEVAFAYSDNDEINSNLTTISAATGLKLPGEQ